MKKIKIILASVVFLLISGVFILATDYTTNLEVKIYPNPYNPGKHKKLTVELSSTPTDGSYQYIIFTYNLKEVYQQTFYDPSKVHWYGNDKSGNRVAPGLYYMKIIVAGGTDSSGIKSRIMKVLVQ